MLLLKFLYNFNDAVVLGVEYGKLLIFHNDQDMGGRQETDSYAGGDSRLIHWDSCLNILKGAG